MLTVFTKNDHPNILSMTIQDMTGGIKQRTFLRLVVYYFVPYKRSHTVASIPKTFDLEKCEISRFLHFIHFGTLHVFLV